MPLCTLKPFWQTTDGAFVKLYQGDVLATLKRMPGQSVQCAITSPPYWGLRDYGTASWEGGNDPNCTHMRIVGPRTNDAAKPQSGYKSGFRGSVELTDHRQEPLAKEGAPCPRCGARRTDQQLGSERVPDCKQLLEVEPGLYRKSNCAERDWQSGCFVCRMVLVFRELRRVLRDDGTLWLNFGDTYASGGSGGSVFENGRSDGRNSAPGDNKKWLETKRPSGLPSGNLMGIPWRVALALQADGWILRSDMPWVKRSSMPESCKNRPAKSLEYVFLLTKTGSGYYFDMEAVKPKSIRAGDHPGGDYSLKEKTETKQSGGWIDKYGKINSGESIVPPSRNFRNADLWFQSIETPHGLTGVGDELVGLDVTSEAYSGAHFATFPKGLVEPFIKCGSSEYGCCSAKIKMLKPRANLTTGERKLLETFLMKKGYSV